MENTLKNSNLGQQSDSFTCPVNKGVEIIGTCPVVACPYHKARLESLFDITTPSMCGLHEPELTGAPSLATLQKSNVRKVSATTLRTTYNQSIDVVKSKLHLINDIPDGGYCESCGSIHEVEDKEVCKQNKTWANSILKYYGLKNNAFRRAIVCKVLRDGSLFTPKKLSDRK